MIAPEDDVEEPEDVVAQVDAIERELVYQPQPRRAQALTPRQPKPAFRVRNKRNRELFITQSIPFLEWFIAEHPSCSFEEITQGEADVRSE